MSREHIQFIQIRTPVTCLSTDASFRQFRRYLRCDGLRQFEHPFCVHVDRQYDNKLAYEFKGFALGQGIARSNSSELFLHTRRDRPNKA